MSTTAQRGIEDVLHDARVRLDRLDPRQASDAVDAAAVLVDIRPQRNRESEGQIPGALVIERNVLEWRLDPASDARLPIAAYDLHVVVVCNEGYTSSLAAAALHEIGVYRATDLIGGYRAWRAAGLPTTEPQRLDPGHRRSRQTGSSIAPPAHPATSPQDRLTRELINSQPSGGSGLTQTV